MRTVLWALLLSLVASGAAAQSFNVDFGSSTSTPGANYAANGLAGVWNAVGVLPAYSRLPLVGLDGQPGDVSIYMAGGTQILETDDATTTGDDEALLDDMLIGFNNPLDVCIWFEHLAPGEYEVLTYALTPGDAGLQNRVRVDFGSPGPTWIGGAWPGIHQQGVTFARHRLTVSSGYIGLHSGQQNAQYQSGIDGIQIQFMPPTSVTPPESDARGAAGIRVFPNPSRAAQTLEFGATPGATSQALEIFDASGRVVWKRALGALAGTHSLAWDGRDAAGATLPAAVYFARLRITTPLGNSVAPPVKLIRVP